jgi:putative chitinase
MITPERIIQFAPRCYLSTAQALAAQLNAALPVFGIVDFLGRAHFMGQACHETAGFSRFEENLNYHQARIGAVWPRLTDRAATLAGNPVALANAAYCLRMGNSDEASGDGYRFRGRGIFQLTGRWNYQKASDALARPYVSNPDLVAQPIGAVLVAAWYWKSRSCGAAASLDDCEGVTRAINGGTNGLADRLELTEKAKRIFA